MSGQLRSVDQAPKRVEPWPEIIADLGYPGPRDVARVLGVDVIHVDHWNQSGSAPKWACLALYWLTSWGRAEVHAQAVRDAQLAMQCLRAVERERDALARQLGRAEGSPMLVTPEQFDALDLPQTRMGALPAVATWIDGLGRQVAPPPASFMGGSGPALAPKSRPA